MSYLDRTALGIREHVASNLIPPDSGTLFLLYAVLAFVKGKSVTTGDVHTAWTAWMDLKGEEHPSKVPFEQLDAQAQAEDQPFVDAIRAVAQGMNRGYTGSRQH